MRDIGGKEKNDMKKTIIYTRERDDIAEAIECGSVVADFLPKPEMLMRKGEEETSASYTGKIIERARKEANITQEELAKRMGSSKSYISRVETGRIEPKVSTFYRIASALGCSVEFRFVDLKASFS